MRKTLTYIFVTTIFGFITLFCVFNFFIPNCVNNSYNVLNEKFSNESNIVYHTTQSLIKVFDKAQKVNEPLDNTQFSVSDLKHTNNKIIGVISNNSNSSVENVQATIIIKDQEGSLKDVSSEILQGIGILKSKKQGHFYIDDIDLKIEEGDQIQIELVSFNKDDFFNDF